MIELKGHSINDRTIRTIEVWPVVPPVISVRSTLEQRQIVDRVTLVFVRYNDGPWKLDRLVAVGDRILKNGGRGTETKVTDFSYARERPDWLVEIVDFYTPPED